MKNELWMLESIVREIGDRSDERTKTQEKILYLAEKRIFSIRHAPPVDPPEYHPIHSLNTGMDATLRRKTIGSIKLALESCQEPSAVEHNIRSIVTEYETYGRED